MRAGLTILMLLVLSAVPAMAAPAPDATSILRRVSENYRSSSSQATLAMTIHRPAWERRMQLKSWTRGEYDALVRFIAPAKDAGNATLKLGRETWVFNPRLNQVIKLPASMLSQSWMGSDFSYNDLARSNELVDQFNHRLLGAEQVRGRTVWTIEAKPKPGAPFVWGKVNVKVRDDYVVTEQVFFDQDMKPARRMQTDEIAPLGGRPYPVTMTMYPLDMPGQWTRVQTTAGQFNVSVPAWLLTLSNLQNPRQ